MSATSFDAIVEKAAAAMADAYDQITQDEISTMHQIEARAALEAVYEDIRAATLNATADALPSSTTPLGGELGISPAVRARVEQWLRAQAGGAA